jgi:hypothetical protein
MNKAIENHLGVYDGGGEINDGAAFVEVGDDGIAVEGRVISAPKATPSMSGGTPRY